MEKKPLNGQEEVYGIHCFYSGFWLLNSDF